MRSVDCQVSYSCHVQRTVTAEDFCPLASVSFLDARPCLLVPLRRSRRRVETHGSSGGPSDDFTPDVVMTGALNIGREVLILRPFAIGLDRHVVGVIIQVPTSHSVFQLSVLGDLRHVFITAVSIHLPSLGRLNRQYADFQVFNTPTVVAMPCSFTTYGRMNQIDSTATTTAFLCLEYADKVLLDRVGQRYSYRIGSMGRVGQPVGRQRAAPDVNAVVGFDGFYDRRFTRPGWPRVVDAEATRSASMRLKNAVSCSLILWKSDVQGTNVLLLADCPRRRLCLGRSYPRARRYVST